MIDTKIKIEILKEVIIKSGMSNNKDVIDSMAEAVKNNNFLFEIIDNEVVKFVTWYPTGDKILVNNLWVDSKYRHKDSLLIIRKYLRNLYKTGVWFNRKKQKMIERR